MTGNGENAAESGNPGKPGKRTENVGGPDPVNAVGVLVPGREKGRDRQVQGRKSQLIVAAESESGIVLGWWEPTAEAGKGVETETERKGAVAGIARETGREARGWMGRRSAREMVPLRVGSGWLRSLKEKPVMAWRSVEIGTEKRTGTADAATGTETGAGVIEREIGSTKGIEERGKGGSAGRSATAPCEMTLDPKMTGAMRMRERKHPTWRSTVRMG